MWKERALLFHICDCFENILNDLNLFLYSESWFIKWSILYKLQNEQPHKANGWSMTALVDCNFLWEWSWYRKHRLLLEMRGLVVLAWRFGKDIVDKKQIKDEMEEFWTHSGGSVRFRNNLKCNQLVSHHVLISYNI